MTESKTFTERELEQRDINMQHAKLLVTEQRIKILQATYVFLKQFQKEFGLQDDIIAQVAIDAKRLIDSTKLEIV